MDAAQVIDLGRESLWVAVMVAAPLLGVALAVGLFVGISAGRHVNSRNDSELYSQARRHGPCPRDLW